MFHFHFVDKRMFFQKVSVAVGSNIMSQSTNGILIFLDGFLRFRHQLSAFHARDLFSASEDL